MRAGDERWELARRSCSIFQRNTTEIMNLLNLPGDDPYFALQLMRDDREVGDPFWEELDQRLHNQLSSAISLVEHARRLLRYYEADFPAVVAEYTSRNDEILRKKEAAFLRDLRNYLLHYGAPPIIQTFESGQAGSRYLLKLSAEHLPKWKDWKAAPRGYLLSLANWMAPCSARLSPRTRPHWAPSSSGSSRSAQSSWTARTFRIHSGWIPRCGGTTARIAHGRISSASARIPARRSRPMTRSTTDDHADATSDDR